jgi:hypothetical protein
MLKKFYDLLLYQEYTMFIYIENETISNNELFIIEFVSKNTKIEYRNIEIYKSNTIFKIIYGKREIFDELIKYINLELKVTPNDVYIGVMNINNFRIEFTLHIDEMYIIVINIIDDGYLLGFYSQKFEYNCIVDEIINIYYLLNKIKNSHFMWIL